MVAYKAVVCDIEGTTTPISFVHNVLFPYSVKHLSQYVTSCWDDLISEGLHEEFIAQYQEDESTGKAGIVRILAANHSDIEAAKISLIDNCLWQIANNRKTTCLKKLQGALWKKGYNDGHLTGVVYDDVVAALNAWKEQKIPIYIYSSGSIEAQKLLFGFSNQGDLTTYLEGYFDTTTGPKGDPGSYSKIAKSINVHPSNILFLTDIESEAAAASEAGVNVMIVIREGNTPLTPECLQKYKAIHSFAEIC